MNAYERREIKFAAPETRMQRQTSSLRKSAIIELNCEHSRTPFPPKTCRQPTPPNLQTDGIRRRSLNLLLRTKMGVSEAREPRVFKPF